MKKLLYLLSFFFLFLIKNLEAHCPLCTAGAMVAAGGAAYLGVDSIVIGIFIGAFAVSMGLWISKLIKKQYVPYQTYLLVLISFLTTVLPVIFALPNSEHEVYPWYISIAGDYGTLLNRTYLFSKVLVGSIIGGIITIFTPRLSKLITKARHGKTFPFQGVAVTFLTLIIIGIIAQVVL